MNIKNLKKAREKMHLTQTQAAQLLGISDNTYKNYEQGKREPNNELLCKISKLYCVPTDYLLGLAPDPDVLNEVATKFNLSALEKELISKYLVIPKSDRDDLMKALCDAVDTVMKENK